jgi:N-acyl-L-homoserine lactone synthetase
MGHNLTLTETLLDQLGAAAPPREGNVWEVGRLVLAPEVRTDVDSLRRCLFLSLDYASANANVQNLYASCTHVLARLYRRFSFSSFAAGVPLAGTEKSYTLIRGHAPQVLNALAGLHASQ